jgi:serine/threonine-protein kinase RsbW
MNKDVQNQSAAAHAEATSTKQSFETPADAVHLQDVVRFVEQALDKYGVAGEARGHICVAIDEAVTNVVMYAYPQEKGTVRISMERQGDRIIIEIVDSGIPFNPLNHPVPDVNASIETRMVGGLGIHLTRHMMDELNYRRADNKNYFTMTKYLGGKK